MCQDSTSLYFISLTLVFIASVCSERERSVFMIGIGSNSTNNFRIYQHRTVSLQCYYDSKSEVTAKLPLVKWWHKGHVISEGVWRSDNFGSSITYISMSNTTYSKRFSLVQTITLSQLTISDVEFHDIGEYRCQVEQQIPRFTKLVMTVNTRFGTKPPKKVSTKLKVSKTTEMLTNKPITELKYVTEVTYTSQKIMHEKIIIMICVLITLGCVVTSILSILFVKHYANEALKNRIQMKFQLKLQLLAHRFQPKRQRTISTTTMSDIESNFKYLKPSSLITADYYKKSSQII